MHMINNVINICREAGEIIRDGFQKDYLVEFKSNSSDLVTEIDKKSERHIIEYITKEYPTHSIITEESSPVENTSPYVWVIDPLDGTVNFAHGLPIFSVSIGIQKNTVTIIGVVYDVMRNIIYASELNGGAYKESKRIKVNSNGEIGKSMLVTGFPYNIGENPYNAIEKFNALLRISRAVRRLGSAAIDFCMLAEGIFDGFWEVHLNPWDICAGKLIVEEAGGLVTDFEGNLINIFSSQILASNGYIHDEMRQILKKTHY